MAVAVVVGLATAGPLRAEGPWTLLGDHGLTAGLAGPRGAGVSFVGVSVDGRTLAAVTASGKAWESSDQGASWRAVEAIDATTLLHPERAEAAPPGVPDALTIRHPYRAGWLYALADDLYRSEDDGATWVGLTDEAALPMIGATPSAIAFDPADPERIFVATEAGLWRSADAGLTWVGLNATLPNFPAGLFRPLDDGAPPLLEIEGLGPALLPGGAPRWILAAQPSPAAPADARTAFEVFLAGGAVGGSGRAGSEEAVTALAVSGGPEPLQFVGMRDGRVWISADAGASWRPAGEGLPRDGRSVVDLWADPGASLAAIAVFAGPSGGRVFRTVDGGRLWDDLTADLPAGEIRAATASADGEAVYAAGDDGVFFASASLRSPTPATSWQAVGDELPVAAPRDLFVNSRTGQLYVSLEGYGVYRRRAPDVLRSLRLLNAADLSDRPVAPGGLLTVVGAAVGTATIDGAPAPVLFASPEESQIQAPFDAAAGRAATVRLSTSEGVETLRFPVQSLAPAIFTTDGEPLVVDAGTGRLLDLTRPARPGSRVLILSAGLGAVNPTWPAGVAAPTENPPAVVAAVSAFLDGVPLEVVGASLAGGYVGAYWVEAQLPSSLRGGLGRLEIEAGGRRSNTVQLFLAP